MDVALLQKNKDGSETLLVYCPGCKMHHGARVKGNKPPIWSFNGDLEKPTLSPSLLSRYPYKGVPNVCHSYIKEGVWHYLGDCTHELAGQKVPMVGIDETIE